MLQHYQSTYTNLDNHKGLDMTQPRDPNGKTAPN